MNLLAIDTTEEACSAAIVIGGETLSRFELAPRRHSELILGMMDSLLLESGVLLSQLDALAFGCGPGSFTGLRIAAGVIQGAALGADLPVVPVSSLAALAQAGYKLDASKKMLAALDARMGEVYWAQYMLGDSGVMELQGTEIVCTPELVSLPQDTGWIGVGSGWGEHADPLAKKLGTKLADAHPELQVTAEYVAQLAQVGFAAGQAVDAALAQPVYIRDKVAEKTKDRI